MAISPISHRRRLTVGVSGVVSRWGTRFALTAGLGLLTYLAASLAFFRFEPTLAAMEMEPAPAFPRPTEGALVICGGGKIPESVRNRFIELAGGRDAKIVLIPTAGMFAVPPADEAFLEPWRGRGLASLGLFHTFSREQANDPAYAAVLADATGVWFGGGRQSLLVDAYRGTEVEKQLRALLARGGVIGGTSAGAAVMSRLMITSGRDEARLGEGFDFLSEAVIDQHFLKRNRLKRLVGVVKRHPEMIGLGVDEQTALVVDVGRKRLQVIGESYVIACLPEPVGADGAPPSTRLEILKPGDMADIDTLKSLKSDVVIPGLELNGF